jgi:hypothetical protein
MNLTYRQMITILGALQFAQENTALVNRTLGEGGSISLDRLPEPEMSLTIEQVEDAALVICDLFTAAMKTSPTMPSSGWQPIVLVSVDEVKGGLHWVEGQGDLSGPRSDDLLWIALSGDSDWTVGLDALKDIPLEPRFAAQVEELRQELEEEKEKED